MVFSSPEFLFLFLPCTVLIYYLLLHGKKTSYITPFLFTASLFYYGYWRPENTWVILASICINYGFGQAIAHAGAQRKLMFITGIATNLGALAYYKYTDFILSSLNAVAQTGLPLQHIILPIGISFFTFQQLSYLSDIYTQKHDPSNEGFINYCCFICFFPQLVAGPIVHHREMMPQFFDARNHTVDWKNIYEGLVLLSIGLGKKVLIADQLSPIVHYCFDEVGSMTFLEAAFGSIAYTLQLYFDFSGYSDMAVGCALFFNIRLPWNFNSPYQATDIQDFWRRWHITLSRWLRDYLYIPLGGNRHGTARTLGNLFLTFLLGGLWHGAAWTFVLWGVMHGAALVIHRVWSQLWKKRMPAVLGWLLTFSFINAAWIVFRAPDFERVEKFIDAFLGYNGLMFRISFREACIAEANSYNFTSLCCLLIFSLSLILLRNTNHISNNNSNISIYFISIILSISSLFLLFPDLKTEFIYFQF